jgi:hypothetical protein
LKERQKMANEKLMAAQVEAALEEAGYRDYFGEITEESEGVVIRITRPHPDFSINEGVAVESVDAAINLGRETEEEIERQESDDE